MMREQGMQAIQKGDHVEEVPQNQSASPSPSTLCTPISLLVNHFAVENNRSFLVFHYNVDIVTSTSEGIKDDFLR